MGADALVLSPHPTHCLGFHRRPARECVVDLPGAAPIRAVHGAPGSVSRFLFPDLKPDRMAHFYRAASLPADRRPTPLAAELAVIVEPLLICGHSHISWQQAIDGKLAVNPGAVDNGLEGDALAHYALLTWRDGGWQGELRGVPYDLARSRAAFRESGLIEEGGPLARAFLLSSETGENVGYFLVLYAYRLAAEAGFPACEVVPHDIWEQAAATFDWARCGSSLHRNERPLIEWPNPYHGSNDRHSPVSGAVRSSAPVRGVRYTITSSSS